MFPAQLLEDAIRGEIESAINDRPTMRAGWEPEVDSLVMVRVVLRIEEDLGISLPDDLMPSGGFNDVEHCVLTVIKACRDLWNTKQPVEEEV